jgi:hypothetical protein
LTRPLHPTVFRLKFLLLKTRGNLQRFQFALPRDFAIALRRFLKRAALLGRVRVLLLGGEASLPLLKQDLAVPLACNFMDEKLGMDGADLRTLFEGFDLGFPEVLLANRFL